MCCGKVVTSHTPVVVMTTTQPCVNRSREKGKMRKPKGERNRTNSITRHRCHPPSHGNTKQRTVRGMIAGVVDIRYGLLPRQSDRLRVIGVVVVMATATCAAPDSSLDGQSYPSSAAQTTNGGRRCGIAQNERCQVRGTSGRQPSGSAK